MVRPPHDTPAAKIVAVLSGVAKLRQASLAQLADMLDLPPPTVHRIASELERLGYLQRFPGTRDWTVSSPLVELSAEVLRAAASFARPQAILRELGERTGEMTTFVVQSGNEVRYLASAEPQQDLMLSFRAGHRAPLYCTSSGRIFLSRMSDEELTGYLEDEHLARLTPYTVTDPAILRKVIRKIREQGYAITAQEYMLHVVGAAVPVVDSRGVMYGTLGISGPAIRVSVDRLRSLVPALAAAASRLANCYAPVLPRGLRERNR